MWKKSMGKEGGYIESNAPIMDVKELSPYTLSFSNYEGG